MSIAMTIGRGRKGVLRKKLRSAQTYDMWKEAAHTLDEYLQFHEWKVVDEDPYYDWRLVKKVTVISSVTSRIEYVML